MNLSRFETIRGKLLIIFLVPSRTYNTLPEISTASPRNYAISLQRISLSSVYYHSPDGVDFLTCANRRAGSQIISLNQENR